MPNKKCEVCHLIATQVNVELNGKTTKRPHEEFCPGACTKSYKECKYKDGHLAEWQREQDEKQKQKEEREAKRAEEKRKRTEAKAKREEEKKKKKEDLQAEKKQKADRREEKKKKEEEIIEKVRKQTLKQAHAPPVDIGFDDFLQLNGVDLTKPGQIPPQVLNKTLQCVKSYQERTGSALHVPGEDAGMPPSVRRAVNNLFPSHEQPREGVYILFFFSGLS